LLVSFTDANPLRANSRLTPGVEKANDGSVISRA